jgi:nucleoside-diphosphate-sugar epimerase
MHRILLTGASGTLGRNLLEIVGNNPDYKTLVLLRLESKLQSTFSSVIEHRCNLWNRNAVSEAVSDFRPDTIIHCAATGMEFPKTEWFDLIRFNVDFTVNLCESAAISGGSHFIFIGTGMAYKPLARNLHESDALDTMHPYGASKAAADLLVRSAAVEFGLPLTVLRPFSFTGLGDDRNRLFPSILRAATSGRVMNLTAGHQVRDHISARDVARGIVAAIKNIPKASEPNIFNLGGGSSIIIRELVEKIVTELNIPVELRFGAKCAGQFEPSHLVSDSSRAKQELGWVPIHRLAHAVWELSRDSFPKLSLSTPREFI